MGGFYFLDPSGGSLGESRQRSEAGGQEPRSEAPRLWSPGEVRGGFTWAVVEMSRRVPEMPKRPLAEAW